MKRLVATVVLTACAALSAGAARDGGFGVRRNFYMSGRISAKVADIAGIFEVNYVGRQPYGAQTFYSSNENCSAMRAKSRVQK